MFNAGIRRRQQGEEQVHRKAVNGVERNRLLEAHDDHPAAFQSMDARMRGGDATAQASGARLFPLQESCKDQGGVETEVLGGLVGDKVHDLAGRTGAEPDSHGARPDQIGNGKAVLQR